MSQISVPLPLPGNAMRAHKLALQKKKRAEMEAARMSALVASGGATMIGINDVALTMDLSAKSQEAQLRHAQILQNLEVRRRIHSVVVPTLMKDVKAKLRELGQPVTLFGEKPEDRLKRLKMIVASKEVEAEESGAVQNMFGKGTAVKQTAPEGEAEAQTKKFYTPASAPLMAVRKKIAEYSFDRARKRLKATREEQTDLGLFRERQQNTVGLYNTLSRLLMNASQIGDSRPLSSCAFSKDDESRMIATSSWSGNMRIWDRSRLESDECKDDSDMLLLNCRGHTERIQHLSFHPQAGRPEGPSENSANIATASADSTAKIWSLKDQKPLQTLEGHWKRLSRVKWHPMGRHVATTSFDTTWRLWDVETGTELLLQEGHARETYGIAIHRDGSLVASGDLGGVGRVWDIRSGKSIFTMQRHVKGILSMDWSPNGWLLATGGDDHCVNLWDLRKKKCCYTLPAHSALVSVVKFAPNSGEFLLTASHDKTCKLWNTRNFDLLAKMEGHEGFIMGADISADEKHFLTASYDRTWKQYAHETEF